MTAETPVLDTLADITVVSLERCSLAPRELMLARIAALIAVDAPAASYLANAGAAADSGVTADDIQAVMIAVAPVVGTPRVVVGGRQYPRGPGLRNHGGRGRDGGGGGRRAVSPGLLQVSR